MGSAVYGSVHISETDYPFSYEEETERIKIYFSPRVVIVPEQTDTVVARKFGMMNGGKYLFKLSTPLSNNVMTIGNGTPQYVSIETQIRTVEYYIDGFEEGSKYSVMRLQFPELDYFIPSVGRISSQDKIIIVSREKDVISSFSFKYHDTDVTISFIAKMTGHACVKATIETVSEIELFFPETNDLGYIKGLYDTVRSFFVFICNRQNIGLRSAELLGQYPAKAIQDHKVIETNKHTRQKMYFSQKYLEPKERKKQVAKTPNLNLFLEKLPELFCLFCEENVGGMATVYGNSMHHSIKYRNLIDLEQSLHITATFEYYVRTILPEMSSQSTLEFINDLGALLDEYIEKNTGKKKKKAQSYRKALSPQISLESKVLKTYNGYDTWPALKPILAEWFGDDISAIASEANKWRNELAHEKREYQPNENVVNAIRLVEHINYCIVLRKAGYDDERIRNIIMETLAR